MRRSSLGIGGCKGFPKVRKKERKKAVTAKPLKEMPTVDPSFYEACFSAMLSHPEVLLLHALIYFLFRAD